jgi:hypothetical protein
MITSMVLIGIITIVILWVSLNLAYIEGYKNGHRDGCIKGHRDGYYKSYLDVTYDFENRILNSKTNKRNIL